MQSKMGQRRTQNTTKTNSFVPLRPNPALHASDCLPGRPKLALGQGRGRQAKSPGVSRLAGHAPFPFSAVCMCCLVSGLPCSGAGWGRGGGGLYWCVHSSCVGMVDRAVDLLLGLSLFMKVCVVCGFVNVCLFMPVL